MINYYKNNDLINTLRGERMIGRRYNPSVDSKKTPITPDAKRARAPQSEHAYLITHPDDMKATIGSYLAENDLANLSKSCVQLHLFYKPKLNLRRLLQAVVDD